MKAQHTQGPWFFHDGNVYAKKSAFIPKLADRSVKIVGYDPNTVFTDKDLSIEEMHANARLIAAAPELLEACKALAMDLENNGEVFSNDEKRIEVLKSAIAKAQDTMRGFR